MLGGTTKPSPLNEARNLSNHPRIGVAIPYYQREPVILTRVLRLVASQRGMTDVRVGLARIPPAHATGELTSVKDGFPLRRGGIAQLNGEPSVA